MLTQYDRSRLRREMTALFAPMLTNPGALSTPHAHLSTLRALAPTLPAPLKPTKLQLSVAHHYGVDMLPSPALRDTLINAGAEVGESFVRAIGSCGIEAEDVGQLVVWGDDALNEMSWEFSREVLTQWGWLLGPVWRGRADFWRRQRGAPLLGHLDGW
jgi:hypothetical protein